jgi:hypothetical protein
MNVLSSRIYLLRRRSILSQGDDEGHGARMRGIGRTDKPEMVVLTQLNPPLPLETSKGCGLGSFRHRLRTGIGASVGGVHGCEWCLLDGAECRSPHDLQLDAGAATRGAFAGIPDALSFVIPLAPRPKAGFACRSSGIRAVGRRRAVGLPRLLKLARHVAALWAFIGYQSRLISDRRDGHDVFHCGTAPRARWTGAELSVRHEL